MTQLICGLILNYRDAQGTARCVKSLLENKVDHVLVWDNSEDGGNSVNQLVRMWQHDSRVYIHRSPVNLGFAAGVNRGIDQILEGYPDSRVLLINNDACLLDNSLSRLNKALDTHPAAVIAYPAINHNGQVKGIAYYQKLFGLLSFDRPFPGSFPYATGCAMLIDPDRITLPLFDEDFFMYGEDVLLGWRLGPERMVFIPDVLVFHEGSVASGLGSEFYETHVVAGHWLLADKLSKNHLEFFMLHAGRWFYLIIRSLIRIFRFRSLLPYHALMAGRRLVRQSVSGN